MAKHWSYVAYHDGVEKVRVVKRKVGSRHLARPCDNPCLVEDEGGEQFVVGTEQLYNNPMEANLAVAKMRAELGVSAARDNPRRRDEDEDLDEDDELDEDDDDDLDEDEDDLEDLDEDEEDEDELDEDDED